MISIKKFILLVLICLISGCTNNVTHKYVNDEDYLTLINLLNEPVIDAEKFIYIIPTEIDSITTKKYYMNYNMTLNNLHKTFSHTINSNTIEVKDVLTNETTIFKDNITITSLEHFSTIILDAYSEEFTYYSMKDFIPLALSLAENKELDFYFSSDKYKQNNYRLTGTIDKLSLDNDLHDALLNNENYANLYNIDNPKITIVFRTNLNNEYFLSSFEFKINDQLIAEIV